MAGAALENVASAANMAHSATNTASAAAVAAQTNKSDLWEAYQRMQAASTEQATARKKLESDCSAQAEAHEARFKEVEKVVHGVLANLEKLEHTVSGLQGQIADARRAQDASTESITAMLKRLLPAEDGEPAATKRLLTKRDDDNKDDDTRANRRERTPPREREQAESGAGGTD